MSDIVYLLWSNKHNAWWAPGAWGYTTDIVAAGRFAEAEAVERVVRSAASGDRAQVTLMVAAPENWTRPEDHPAESGAGAGEADAATSAAGAPAGPGAPAHNPGEPPYASPFAYRAERRWTS